VPTFCRTLDTDVNDLNPSTEHRWTTRFNRAVQNYHSAQGQFIEARKRGLPTPQGCRNEKEDEDQVIEDFKQRRRKVGGWEILFALYERLEGIRFQYSTLEQLDGLEKLRHLTADILSWILDVASYNLDQSQNNPNNLIAVLISHNHLSLQCAVNYAESEIKCSLSSFQALEESLLSPRHSPESSLNYKWSSILSIPKNIFSALVTPRQSSELLSSSSPSVSTPNTNTMSSSYSPQHSPPQPSLHFERNHDEDGDGDHNHPNTNTEEFPSESLQDLHSSIQNLKDCIVGVINWIYETELYFGSRGDEVRTFRWIFLKAHS